MGILGRERFWHCHQPDYHGEIYEGIYFGGQRQQGERDFSAFLRVVPVLPLNRPIMRRFARIRGQLRQQGLLIC
jgi:predicted nucleic acid-binding protein